MARSFYRPQHENTVEDYRENNTYYNKASDTYFSMIERNGKYYQRRYQIGLGGKQTNVEEKQIDFVMGSGNHVRTYLHRTAANELQELPLAWYSENGGHWGMNPGYDSPDQSYSLRKISYECMFCHNSYPDIPAKNDELRSVFADALPEGIDCQRCHGPGRQHVEATQTVNTTLQAIRSAIVNPARLSADRQMEVCMQCHLETTSAQFPHSILKYDRGPFSYRPGEPLSEFTVYFDHSPRPGEDRFEIAGSVYRLRMSQCFTKSGGALKCTTCHDPHDIPHNESAAEHYNSVCQQCHTGAFKAMVATARHTAATNCIDCHMPKRRTSDVVHVAMTDHYIQRNIREGDLLAEEPESKDSVYHGAVLPYYPVQFDTTKQSELYLAVAQVTGDTNIGPGISQLTAALEKYSPAQPEFYNELADAWLRSGQPDKAMPLYEEALRRKPDSLVGLRGLGVALEESNLHTKAAETFQKAIQLAPSDAQLWQALAQVYVKQGQRAEALAALQKSLALDPEIPETHFALGNVSAQRAAGGSQAEASYLEAIRLKPNYIEAHVNLAILLAQQNRIAEASYHFEYALRLQPDYSLVHLYYGLMLDKAGQIDKSAQQLQAAANADPGSADAYEALGELEEKRAATEKARSDFSEALRIRPKFGKAQLELGELLAAQGNLAEARQHLVQASQSSDPAIRQRALGLLSEHER